MVYFIRSITLFAAGLIFLGVASAQQGSPTGQPAGPEETLPTQDPFPTDFDPGSSFPRSPTNSTPASPEDDFGTFSTVPEDVPLSEQPSFRDPSRDMTPPGSGAIVAANVSLSSVDIIDPDRLLITSANDGVEGRERANAISEEQREKCSQALLDYYSFQSGTEQGAPARSAFRKVLEHCFAEEGQDKLRLAQYWSESVRQVAERTVVLKRPFSDGKWRAYCSGYLVSPKKIITAAHCLDANPADGTISPDLCTSPLKAVMLDGEEISITLQAAPGEFPGPCDFSTIPIANLERDVVLLSLTKAPRDLPASLVSTANTPEETDATRLRSVFDDFTTYPAGKGLFIIGMHPLFDFHQNLNLGAGSDGQGVPRDLLLLMRSDGCRVLPPTGQAPLPGKILHQCLAQSGMSGAPMFVRATDGSLEFIGLHLGAVIKRSNCVGIFRVSRGNPSGWCTDQIADQLQHSNVAYRFSEKGTPLGRAPSENTEQTVEDLRRALEGARP